MKPSMVFVSQSFENWSCCAQNDKDNDMMTPLLYACENGAEDCVEVLLKEGADIHVKNNAGRTPLRIAKEHGDARAVSAIEEESRRRRHTQ